MTGVDCDALRGSVLENYTPVPEAGCWLWLGYSMDGYGYFKQNGRPRRAHRAFWEAFNGPIPDGLFVCHKCDTRLCVNPDHLFLGDNTVNTADRHAKNRNGKALGAINGASKLTDEIVQKILSDTRAQTEIAADYGVGQTLISQIKRRVIWKHVRLLLVRECGDGK